MFRSHSEATIAVANCTTLFFLARKILNYIRLQSARVSGKPLENRRGQHVDKRASHSHSQSHSHSWHLVTLPRSLHRNNPPNFPFLSPPRIHCSLLLPLDKNNNCLSPAVHSFSTFSSGTFFARIVRTLSGCCRRRRRCCVSE